MSTQLEEDRTLPCPYCGASIDAMPSPRRLPCGHIFCRQCLSVAHEKAGRIMCKHCSRDHGTEVKVDDLPLDFGPHHTCQPCGRRGQVTKAVTLCRTCQQNAQRFCDKHVEVSVMVRQILLVG